MDKIYIPAILNMLGLCLGIIATWLLAKNSILASFAKAVKQEKEHMLDDGPKKAIKKESLGFWLLGIGFALQFIAILFQIIFKLYGK